MPTLRSQTSSRLPATVQSTDRMKDQNQWVFFGPEIEKLRIELLRNSCSHNDDCFGNNATNETVFHKLPHPQNGVVSLFGFNGSKCYELMKFKEQYRSFFIDNTVQKDGSVTMITLLDPLFLVLPYLEKAAKQEKDTSYDVDVKIQGRFTTFDNIMIDENFTPGVRALEMCVNKQHLQNVCACKGDEDYTAYKIDEDKVISWLTKKVKRLSSHLKNTSDINVCAGGQLSNYSRTSAGNKDENECLRYAWSLVSDYLSEERSLKLKDILKITDLVKESNDEVPQPPSKKQKLESNNNSGCIEDYRDHTEKKDKKPVKKLSASQKALQKVDKKGMKSMTSFFASKAKK